MFKEVADIQTADMLNLPVPEAKFVNIIVESSEIQQEMVQELSERAAAVQARKVDPSSDNMLKITTDGRKIGLDQRLMNPLLPDHEGSKINACTDKVFEIWNDTREGRLTQLVFSDFSTPNKDGRFNIYDDIRTKLITRGIPASEIAFIHEADTETKKKELFAKVRQGKVRVLLGSTFKMGAGTNVQDRLIATHDVDCPWRPAEIGQTQRWKWKRVEDYLYSHKTAYALIHRRFDSTNALPNPRNIIFLNVFIGCYYCHLLKNCSCNNDSIKRVTVYQWKRIKNLNTFEANAYTLSST